MGRWAQRSRSGGGAQVLNSMVGRLFTSPATLRVYYATAVTALAFSGDEFTAQPSGTQALTVTQNGPTAVLLDFGVAVNTDTTLEYAGSATGVVTPQTISIV